MEKDTKFKKGQRVVYFKKCARWLVEGTSPLEKGKTYAITQVEQFNKAIGYCLKIEGNKEYPSWWVTGECLKLPERKAGPYIPQVGDKVKIVVKPDMEQEENNGYQNTWVARMNEYPNNRKIYTIREITLPGSGIYLVEDGEYGWPAGCFKLA
jgi:hypothetical protein